MEAKRGIFQMTSISIIYEVYSSALIQANNVVSPPFLKDRYNEDKKCFVFSTILDSSFVEETLNEKGRGQTVSVNLAFVHKETDIPNVLEGVEVALKKYLNYGNDMRAFIDKDKVHTLITTDFLRYMDKELDLISFMVERGLTQMFKPLFKIREWDFEDDIAVINDESETPETLMEYK